MNESILSSHFSLSSSLVVEKSQQRVKSVTIGIQSPDPGATMTKRRKMSISGDYVKVEIEEELDPAFDTRLATVTRTMTAMQLQLQAMAERQATMVERQATMWAQISQIQESKGGKIGRPNARPSPATTNGDESYELSLLNCDQGVSDQLAPSSKLAVEPPATMNDFSSSSLLVESEGCFLVFAPFEGTNTSSHHSFIIGDENSMGSGVEKLANMKDGVPDDRLALFCESLCYAHLVFDENPERDKVTFEEVSETVAESDDSVVVSEVAVDDKVAVEERGVESVTYVRGKGDGGGALMDAIMGVICEQTKADGHDVVVSWTTMIGGFAWNEFCREVILHFLEMKGYGIKPNGETFISLVYACAGIEVSRIGMQLHCQLIVGDGDHDDYDGRMSKGLIHMYSTYGIMDYAEILFTKHSNSRSVQCCNSNGYLHIGKLEQAQNLFDILPMRDKISWTSMITGYFSVGEVSKACYLFQIMPNKDAISWTSMISRLVHNELSAEAINIFFKMRADGVSPLSSAYSVLLRAAGAVSHLDSGRQGGDRILASVVAVSSSGVMNLTAAGLGINDPDGSLAWSTPVLKSTVNSMLLAEEGNLILLDEFNVSLWESFDYPTDTIVIGQRLTIGSFLASSVSSSNFSTGNYKLVLSSSDVMLQWHGETYWKLSMETLAYKNLNYVAEYMSLNRTGLQLLGHNGYVTVIQVLLTASEFQIAQLVPSGKFIVQSFSDSKWTTEFEWPSDTCKVSSFCGRLGLCSSTLATCSSCPSNFHASYVTVEASQTVTAGFPDTVPLRTVNKQCSSGLQAVVDVAAFIKAGYYDIGIAAGVKCMSNDTISSISKLNPKAEAFTQARDCLLPMGVTYENVAQRYGVTRQEQDQAVVESHRRAAAASAYGKFKDEIVPVSTKIVDPKTGEVRNVTNYVDDGIRPNTNMTDLAKLKPAFKKDGTTTAGNASQVSDGAGAVLLMKRSLAIQKGLPILGIFRSFAAVGVDPAVMGVGPAAAIPVAVKSAGLELGPLQDTTTFGLLAFTYAYASNLKKDQADQDIHICCANINVSKMLVGKKEEFVAFQAIELRCYNGGKMIDIQEVFGGDYTSNCVIHYFCYTQPALHVLISSFMEAFRKWGNGQIQDAGIVESARKIAEIQNECKLETDVEEYVESTARPFLMDVIYCWSKGASFAEVIQMTEIFEGSIIRYARRLDESLNQLRAAVKEVQKVAFVLVANVLESYRISRLQF